MTQSSTPASAFARSSGLRYVGIVGCVLAVLCGVALITSGFGYRWGWWGLDRAFRMLRWSAYGGVVTGALCVIAVAGGWLSVAREGGRAALVGMWVSVAVVGIPWTQLQRARRAPPIHDITTDTEHPPVFVAVAPLRTSTPNGAAYGGPEIAAKQRAAYPDLQPVLLPLAPAEAFRRALDVVRDIGWEIVATDSSTGRIEATATTFWYGFKDDVVIRLTLGDGGTLVDVRSASRVGRNDSGANARRIRALMKRLQS